MQCAAEGPQLRTEHCNEVSLSMYVYSVHVHTAV